MERIQHIILAITFTTIALVGGRVQAQSSRYDELAKLHFPGAYPSEAAAATFKDELAFRRGVQSYLWALPAMNMFAMREGQRKAFGGGSNTMTTTGLLPVRFGVEMYHYIDKPDNFGPEWQFRLTCVPVVPKTVWAKRPMFRY